MFNWYFSLLLTLLTSMSTIAFKDLPGLDYLSTGFDASKMINLNEAPSASDKLKFRLFDLDDHQGKNYLLDTDGANQTYTTSLYVHATTINMNTKVSLASLSTSMQQFERSYFQSYSFDIAVPIATPSTGSLTPSFGFHKTLRQAYGALTRKESSIGTSSDWWGLYSVHLGPIFLLDFNPLFIRTLDRLVSDPKTSRHQAYYNRLIETFGTHYVSSVIVGGSINLYTYVKSSYQSEHSSSSVQNDIKIGLSVAMQGGLVGVDVNAGFTWGSEVSSLTETFKNNTEMRMQFSPAIVLSPATQGQQWIVWKRRTLSDPAVVNRTLSPLVNLLMDYPEEVQEHLQATIDYYLVHGTVPTLEQALEVKTQRKKSLLIGRAMKQIPGLDVVGCGFDITAVENRRCLFDFSGEKNVSSTWANVYKNNELYTVPQIFAVSSELDVNATYISRFFKTIDEFFQQSIWSIENDDWNFFGFGTKSTRNDIIEKYQKFYEYQYQMVLTRRRISMYTLSVNTSSVPKFNSFAQLAIDALPSIFNESSAANLLQWEEFFSVYGTHFVASADMGGLMWAEDYFDSCLMQKTSETWIKEQIKKRYWFFAKDLRIKRNENLDVDDIYKTYSIFTSTLIGGINKNHESSSIDPFTINAWISSLKNHPKPVAYRLIPIYSLLPTGERKEALKSATYYFRSRAVKDANIFIQHLQSSSSRPPLPKLDC